MYQNQANAEAAIWDIENEIFSKSSQSPLETLPHSSVKAANKRCLKMERGRRGAPRIPFSKPVSINIYFSERALSTVSKFDQI